MLVITHTHGAGTLVEGTAKGDGTAEILKAHRWRWSRHLGSWYVPRSRDTHAESDRIAQTADALRAAGYKVTVSIDNASRDLAQVEADKAQRSTARAAALAVSAQRQHAEADRHSDRADRYLSRFFLGQPILVGHHSEGTARNAHAKGLAALRRSVSIREEAIDTQRRADAASHATGARYNSATVADRIARLEADARRLTRKIDGHTRTVSVLPDGQKIIETTAPARGVHADKLRAMREQIDAQIIYWRGIRDAQIATGAATNYSREIVDAGDSVKVNGEWYRVVRANKTTVTLQSATGRGRIAYTRIQAHQRPA